ncbi:hypothetical protein GGX14DRAFT_575797 [Mycena pura]|uniref:Uncharacterized protein n=1 Tax=Mycena pura TaxID=153505 RepID=A0AAD6UY78_9AGAR|nr:hypothetical protein GGX14DRAFT_575797 [Mycena pura]
MTCVVGDSRYRYYPNPASFSSSPESVQAPISSRATRVSSAAAYVPTQAGAVVDTLLGRSASNLDTPAASDDFSGNNPGGVDEVNRFEALVRSNAGSAQIEPLQLKMSQEMADELEEIFSEERDFKSVPFTLLSFLFQLRLRLEYLQETGMLIVTYATAVHESFGPMMDFFTDIATVDKSFIVGFNTEISIPSIRRRRIPDLVFGKEARGPKALPEYGIIIEAGYSQRVPDLGAKAIAWFAVPTVDTVITIKFVCAEFASPKTKSRPSSPVDLATFSKDWVPGLGEMVYDGHTWAPAIEAIDMNIYIRDPATKAPLCHGWNVHPGASDLAKSQADIVVLIRRMIRHFMGKSAFQAIYPDKETFTIDWKKFYLGLNTRLLTDAYERYIQWVGEETGIATPQKTLLMEEGAVLRKIFCALQDFSRSPGLEQLLYPCWKAGFGSSAVTAAVAPYPIFKDLNPSDHRERVTPDFVGTWSGDVTFQRRLLLLVELKPLLIPYSEWFSETGWIRAQMIFEIQTKAVLHQLQAQNHFAKKRFHGTN